MRTAALLLLAFTLPCARAQETGTPLNRQSLGFDLSYSPNSSHILIGQARKRRTWTSGIEYTHLLHTTRTLRLDYEASLLPFFLESDPTVTGTTTTIDRQNITLRETPFRVTYVPTTPIGTASLGNGHSAPVYALYGRQNTYAAALSPLGARLSALPRRRIQPSLSLDLGFVVSSRDLPVDLSDQFNYLFSFGPGVQLFTTPRTSIRLEYLYRHISNAHQGYQNPGLDEGTFRLTLSKHR